MPTEKNEFRRFSPLLRYWGCCCIRWLIIRCGRRRWGYCLVSWWVWYRVLVVGARCDRREEGGIGGFGSRGDRVWFGRGVRGTQRDERGRDFTAGDRTGVV